MSRLIVSAAEPSKLHDWSDQLEEDEWSARHQRAAPSAEEGIVVEDVVAVTCGDDGFVHVWRPIQVSHKTRQVRRQVRRRGRGRGDVWR